MDRLTHLPAYRLAALVKSREISAQALTEAYLRQIEVQNPHLNALCTLNVETARASARVADAALDRDGPVGPLHGVPITIKDLFNTQRLRTTAGFTELSNYEPRADAPMVARLRQAGAILLGKTNVSRAGGDYQTNNAVFGQTHNPWDENCTPGGSSGGSAAAVAAGLSSLDLCSDYGGSIRQPAHFCGVYGLKPTDRRVPTVGHVPPLPGLPESIRQMLTVGLLARSVQDLRLGLEIIAGPVATQPDIPPVPLATPSPQPLTQRRLAWCEGLSPLWPHTDIRTTLAQAAHQLSQAGATLTPWEPLDWDWERWLKTYYRIATASLRYVQRPTVAALWEVAQQFRHEWWQSDAEFRSLTTGRLALPALLNPSLETYFQALTERDRLTAEINTALADYDALLLPVAMTTAFTHRPTGSAIAVEGKAVPYWLANGAYLQIFNLSGHPVVVIPVGTDQKGLPIGLQIIGHRWQEMELLAIAQQIDKAVGNFQHPPGYE